MTTQYSYNTVTEAINGMRQRGFITDFNLSENCLTCNENKKHFPEDFEITEVYRFEGDSDPADEAIVYGIESKLGKKGVLVNGYGISSESMADEMIKKLRILH
ncbi:MAG: phosphoribosylpyrophosphate synthetase [Bacteroidia bacterium]